MNKGDLRTRALDRRSWHADVDDDFNDEVDRSCIDVALKRLASEVPEAFIPDQETVFFLEAKDRDDLSRTLAATSDPYVLSFGAVGSSANITTDGTWDGLFHLEITSPDGDGRTFRRQCREFFTATVGGVSTYLVSLDRPWRNSTDTAMEFRLYQPYFFVRDDVTKIVDGRLFDSSRRLIDALPAGFARYSDLEPYRGQSVGRPCAISRWQHFQLPAPTRACTATLDTVAGTWVGPEPLGTFAYRYTYVWGKKDFEGAAPGGSYDPVWESAPSPVSATITMSIVASDVELSNLTNIDHILNFDPTPAALRNGHSGLRKRIYRARTAVTSGGAFETAIEAPGIYFYLAEVDGDDTTYTDDGSAIPDYHRRLPESHGYYAWMAHPTPDAAYELDLRVYRRPLSLLTDTDTPQIHPDFEDMLLLLVLRYLAELDKQPADAADYEAQYTARVAQWRAREANPATYVPPVPWSPDYNLRPPYYYGEYDP